MDIEESSELVAMTVEEAISGALSDIHSTIF